MTDKTELYHYLESGLDNVYLVVNSGVQFVEQKVGRVLKIKDVEGLHRLIGQTLAVEKKNLSGKEVRFLRQELLLSQNTLAKLLGVTEQTVHRWEVGKADIPKPAENLIRSLYISQFKSEGESFNVREALERLADLEDQMDVLKMKRAKTTWQVVESMAA